MSTHIESARFGYDDVHWGVSGELSHELMLATHLRHSDLYRSTAYAAAKDGWYAIAGSTTLARRRALRRSRDFRPGRPRRHGLPATRDAAVLLHARWLTRLLI